MSPLAKPLLRRAHLTVGMIGANDSRRPPRPPARRTEDNPGARSRIRSGDSDLPTVLLVEDDRDTQNLIRLALRRTCRLVVASDPRQARAALASGAEVGLILMDVRLPGAEDGLALTCSLRRETRWRRVPIIAATACVEPVDLIRAVSSGCNGVLPKPFSLQQLRGVLRRYLPR